MVRLKITLSYVGTQYCGWQIQEKPKAPPTIQGELESVVQRVVGTHVRIHGAGRTDSGVHAEGQVAHMDVPHEKGHLQWQRIFNTSLPQDISVLDVSSVEPHFHSRFDAIHKTYTYTFWCERTFMPPRLRPFAYNVGNLDYDNMRKALPYLMGTHNFAAMQNVGTPIEDTIRTIMHMELAKQCPWLPKALHPHCLTLTVQADGFLKQMVRNLAGLLAAVGKHKFSPEQIPALLDAGLRNQAPATAPACGLSLQHIYYA